MNINDNQWLSKIIIKYQWELKESGDANCNWKIFAEDKSLIFLFIIKNHW